MVIKDRDSGHPSDEDLNIHLAPGIGPVSQEDPTFIPSTTGNGGIGGRR